MNDEDTSNLLYRCVESVMGRVYNLRTAVRKAPDNPILESAYLKEKSPGHETVEVSCLCLWFFEVGPVSLCSQGETGF